MIDTGRGIAFPVHLPHHQVGCLQFTAYCDGWEDFG